MSKVSSKLEKILKATKSYRIYYYMIICHTQNNTCTDYHIHVKLQQLSFS